jgi:hypothetical protein
MGAATQAEADARGCSMTIITGRRTAIQTLGLGIAASAIGLVIERTPIAQAALSPAFTPQGAGQLNALMQRLAKAPRRRDFKSVPMILTNPEQWDHEALSESLAYKPVPKQAWDSTDIAGPWLNLMRNALNAEIWSFRHPDFLAVSVTHGTAKLPHEALAAELTNHLVAGAVLIPGAAATMPELQQVGFHYAK